MAHLFATTDLERSYRVNLNVIAHRRPAARHGAEGAAERVAGVPPAHGAPPAAAPARQGRRGGCTSSMAWLIAYLNLDEVIRIIRREEEPKPVLIKRFKLSDEQAEAILETKLRHLAKLEEMKIREEQRELAEERDQLRSCSPARPSCANWYARRSSADAEEYGDERRTRIVERAAAQAIEESELLANEPVTVVLSTGGWVRSAKGHDIDPRTSVVQDRRCLPGRGARPQHPAGGVHRQHRPRLQPAGAQPALGARAGRAAVGAARSARWRAFRRRAAGRSGGSVAARDRRGLRLHACGSRNCIRAIAPARRCSSSPPGALVLPPVPGAAAMPRARPDAAMRAWHW